MTQSVNHSLGDEFTKDNQVFRIIRIVHQDCLFETQEGVCEVVTEHLMELKDQEGHIDFEVLTSERKPYEGNPSQIKAPEPIVWRRD